MTRSIRASTDEPRQFDVTRGAVDAPGMLLRPGWTRISLHYTMAAAAVDYLVDAVTEVAKKGAAYQKGYDFDRATGAWKCRPGVFLC